MHKTGKNIQAYMNAITKPTSGLHCTSTQQHHMFGHNCCLQKFQHYIFNCETCT